MTRCRINILPIQTLPNITSRVVPYSCQHELKMRDMLLLRLSLIFTTPTCFSILNNLNESIDAQSRDKHILCQMVQYSAPGDIVCINYYVAQNVLVENYQDFQRIFFFKIKKKMQYVLAKMKAACGISRTTAGRLTPM